MGFSVSFPGVNKAEQVVYVDPNNNTTNVTNALNELYSSSPTLTWTIVDIEEFYTASSGDLLAVKNCSGIILPDTPEEGATISITDYNNIWGSTNLNVESFNTIDNQPAPFILDVNLKYGKVTFIYDSINSDWRILVHYLGMQTETFDASSDTTSVNNTNTTVDSQ